MSFLTKLQRCIALGPRSTYQIIQARIERHVWQSRVRTRAVQGTAHTRWSYIEQRSAHLGAKPLIMVRMFMQEPQEMVIEKANNILNNRFFLFNRYIHISTVNWHTDFLWASGDHHFNPSEWYADITIPVGQSEQLHKDIRVPWELSRFSYAWQLAYAYTYTQNQQYVEQLLHLIQDWIDKNLYLLGINWVCPMEVALRALNWIIALDMIPKEAVPPVLWRTIVCSLYDHMRYLEHNWEWYDGKTSNHYLSNVVGYLAVTDFFGQNQKSKKAFQQLCAEFEKQVFDEGTDYEGSTAYHALVTELFAYGFALSIDMNLPVSAAQMKKLQRMVAFSDWCTPVDGQPIVIGDTDSSVAVTGLSGALRAQVKSLLPPSPHEIQSVKTFNDFGISFIKTETWHISLRHHAYQQRQPSGHFHADAGSITLAYKGIPIIIDPGSYVYSASKPWRNHFRSAQAHNSFGIEGIEPIDLNKNLFTLALPEQQLHLCEQEYELYTVHDLYQPYGLHAHRKLFFDPITESITITDWWQVIGSVIDNTNTVWHFRIAPDLEVEQIDGKTILIKTMQGPLRFCAEGQLQVLHDFAGPSYGYKVPCQVIKINMPLVIDKPQKITIQKMG